MSLERTGSTYAVAEVSIRYRRPARLSDDLVIVSTVPEVRAASVLIQQRVMRNDELLANADVTVAFISADLRPQRQPSEWVERFRSLAGQR